MGQDPSEIREEIEQTRSEMGNTVDALAHKTDVKSRVKESFDDKKERLRSQMQGASSRVGDATPDSGQMKEGAKHAVGVAEENPIGLALGGVAVGFLAGMMFPTTRIEDERVGPLADQVKEKAVETGQEAIERGKDVAGQVAEQAAETAKEAGQEQAEELKSSVQGEGQQGDGQQQSQGASQPSGSPSSASPTSYPAGP
jgi:gas vesicle protein